MISNSIQFGVFSVCVVCNCDGMETKPIFLLVVVVVIVLGGENKQGLLPSIICIIFPPPSFLSLYRCKDMNLLKGKCIIICIYGVIKCILLGLQHITKKCTKNKSHYARAKRKREREFKFDN